METISASEARRQLFRLLKESNRKSKQFRIPYKEGNAVLLSEEDYESLVETLYLLSSPDFRRLHRKARKEIAEGKTTPLDEVFE